MAFEPFENLKLWQAARELRKAVYTVSKSFPKIEEYALANQIRRAQYSRAMARIARAVVPIDVVCPRNPILGDGALDDAPGRGTIQTRWWVLRKK